MKSLIAGLFLLFASGTALAAQLPIRPGVTYCASGDFSVSVEGYIEETVLCVPKESVGPGVPVTLSCTDSTGFAPAHDDWVATVSENIAENTLSFALSHAEGAETMILPRCPE